MLFQTNNGMAIIKGLSVIILLSLLVSCSTATTTPVQPTLSPVEPGSTFTPPPPDPTATSTIPAPTETPTLEPTPAPTATPIPPTVTPTSLPDFDLLPEGVTGWCLPEGMLVPAISQDIPANARSIRFTQNALEVDNLPASSCTLIFVFNQAIPQDMLSGLKFQLYDGNTASPWLERNLQPVEGHPYAAGLVITHSYFIAPPWWDISYTFSITTPDGNLIDRLPANLHRWKPAKCWDENYPYLDSMQCPLPQDQHPWDTWYGKPMPTGIPSDN